MHRVEITKPAARDIQQNHDWWAENRSLQQAARWYDGVIDAMFALAKTANRYSYATEPELKKSLVKQVPYGLGRIPSHRILFGVRENIVFIYRVRAFKQDAITYRDLTD